MLGRLSNNHMTKVDRVGRLLKGIAEEAFTYSISEENVACGADVQKYCRAFEAVKARRIRPKFGQLPNVATVGSADTAGYEDIASVVHGVVLEALAAQSSSMSPPHIVYPEGSFPAPRFETSQPVLRGLWRVLKADMAPI